MATSELEIFQELAGSVIRVKPGLWAYAHLLGEARRKTNKKVRAEKRNRGKKKNKRNDLLGAFSELFAYGVLIDRETSEASKQYVRDLIYWEKRQTGVNSNERDSLPDLLLDGKTGIEVKSFGFGERHVNFAINDGKHAKLERKCDGYLCILSPPYGRRLWVAELVPWSDVEEWQPRRLPPHNDLARVLPIKEFCERYCYQPSDEFEKLRTDTYDGARVERFSEQETLRERLVQHFPALRKPIGVAHSDDKPHE